MKTKIYNKELYKAEQAFDDIVAVLIAFFLGIALGVQSMRTEFKNNGEYRNSLEENKMEVSINEERKMLCSI